VSTTRESKAKFRKAGKSRKNSRGRALRFVDNPNGQQLFALDELLDAQLQIPPQVGTPIGRLQTQRAS
jgi:hypothetical protein